MTIQEFQNRITELIDEGRLSPDMEIVTFDGNVYYEIKTYCLATKKILENGETTSALVIDTDY